MKEKKVAVIMSTYNGEKFIREQLDSILNQSYKNIDLIVRDDGSKDKTVEIIKEYQEKHKNIKLYEGQNLGFVKSFFELLKLADADYYAYADRSWHIGWRKGFDLYVADANEFSVEEIQHSFYVQSLVEVFEIPNGNYTFNGEQIPDMSS